MACSNNEFNLGIRNIIVGTDRAQTFDISTKADVASSLGGMFLVIHEPVTQVKHVFWMDDGIASSPAIPNATHHAVTYSPNATANTIAGLLNTVINALLWINSTVSANVVSCTMVADGYAYEARDALLAADRTFFNINMCQFGNLEYDAGATSGDIVFTVAENTKEVKSPQTGDFLLGEIRRGSTVSSTFELKSTSEDSIRKAINQYGSTIVTDDAASSVLSGNGTSNLFKNTNDIADRIIFRPTDKAADNDSSEDFTIHKSRMKLGALTMSAENELVLPTEVVSYLDTSKSSFINMFSYGDSDSVPLA